MDAEMPVGAVYVTEELVEFVSVPQPVAGVPPQFVPVSFQVTPWLFVSPPTMAV